MNYMEREQWRGLFWQTQKKFQLNFNWNRNHCSHIFIRYLGNTNSIAFAHKHTHTRAWYGRDNQMNLSSRRKWTKRRATKIRCFTFSLLHILYSLQLRRTSECSTCHRYRRVATTTTNRRRKLLMAVSFVAAANSFHFCFIVVCVCTTHYHSEWNEWINVVSVSTLNSETMMWAWDVHCTCDVCAV